jgi:hypothetical protein
MPFLTDLQNGQNLALRVFHGQCEIRSMASAVLPEDQSKTLGNLQITAADVVEVEVEVALEAVEVLAEVQVALEVKPGEVANDSASREDKFHEVNHEVFVPTKCKSFKPVCRRLAIEVHSLVQVTFDGWSLTQ